MRENVLRNLASRAVTDLTFLRQARQDLQGTLARHGYRLTDEEARLVEGLRQQTTSMTDEELAHMLASGLEGRNWQPSRPSYRSELARIGARKTLTTRELMTARAGFRPAPYGM
jgi:hypothetical protein